MNYSPEMLSLSEAYDNGSLDTMPLDDLISLARKADEDGTALSAVLDRRIGMEDIAVREMAKADANGRNAAYHDLSRRGIIRATGVSEGEYDRAVIDSKMGDPSPLLKLRTDYMDSF